MAKILTHERLREVLHYNPKTGEFIWRVSTRRVPQGSRAGTLVNNYWFVGIDGKRYKASRLAVFWMTGQWPKRNVDHKNTRPSDDRWRNLREATQSQNLANRKSTSPFKGVCYRKDTGKYQAQIRFNYRQIHLGCFDTPEQAHARYLSAAREYFGEFARG